MSSVTTASTRPRPFFKRLRVTPAEKIRYERFVRIRKTTFSQLVRDLLDREIEKSQGKAAA